MQPCLSIKIFARKAQIVLYHLCLHLSLAKGQIRRLPDHDADRINQPLRGTEVVVDEIVRYCKLINVTFLYYMLYSGHGYISNCSEIQFDQRDP